MDSDPATNGNATNNVPTTAKNTAYPYQGNLDLLAPVLLWQCPLHWQMCTQVGVRRLAAWLSETPANEVITPEDVLNVRKAFCPLKHHTVSSSTVAEVMASPLATPAACRGRKRTPPKSKKSGMPTE